MEQIPVDYGKVKPYDTTNPPIRQPFVITALLQLLCRMSMLGKDYKIEKINMEGLKPPYILLCNHMYFVDFYFQYIATWPHRSNTIVTIDGYYRRPPLLWLIGSMCKRKFTTDVSLIRSIRTVLRKYGDILCMYPEARYSPCGTTAILPDSLAKLVKLNKVPVVVLLHHGNYLHTPFWNYRKPRKVPFYTTMTQILSAEDVQSMSVEEIDAAIRKAMEYDEYCWQKEQQIAITEPFRAEGLHKVLYQCPHCLTEHEMTSEGSEISCGHCGKTWEMDEYGQLHALNGETEFAHIPDWFAWERSQVRRQLEEGSYRFEDEVEIHSLVEPWKFRCLGMGKLVHDPETGMTVTGRYNGKDFCINRPVLGMYGIHVEYDYCYIRPDDCVDISTENDSLYCYPTKKNVVTKLSFAVEELYKMKKGL
jgi:hypothetical protein